MANYIKHTFAPLTAAGVTPAFLADIGLRDFPFKHTLSFEFGGTVKPTSVNATLEGSNAVDGRIAGEEEWFEIVGPQDFPYAGANAPAPHLTYDDAVAKWVRVRINSITGGTAPTVIPVYAGLAG